MFLKRRLAALAAVVAAVALAVPAANASASTTAHAVRTTSIGHFVASPLTCRILVGDLRFAMMSGNTFWANYVARVLQYSGCGGAAI